jgi:hypothetical protein
MNKKLILGIAFAVSGLTFATDVKAYVSPYITYISYDNSKFKRDGYSFTLYGSLSFKRATHVLEFAYGNTHLNYKNSYTDWNQNDYALAYTNYMFFPYYFKVGYHYISTPNTDISDNTQVYFADLGYIKRYKWTAGAGIYYSNYQRDIDVLQFTPHFGKCFWKDYYRGFYVSVDANWINADDVSKIGLSKNNYYSAGLSVSYFTPKYSVGAKGWLGEAIFKVDNGGFVVYNLKEKYKGGAGIFGKYYFNRKINVGINLDYSTYKEVDSGRNVNTYIATLSLGYSF